MNYNKLVSHLAESIQLFILHNGINSAGDVDEEQMAYLFGNIQKYWPSLRESLSHKAVIACEEMIRGLYTDYDNVKMAALTLFGHIAVEPSSYMRSDLVFVSRRG